MTEVYAIDGSNVCHWQKNYKKNSVSLAPLLSIILEIIRTKDDFFCVFDASLKHHLKNKGDPEEVAIFESLIDEQPSRFLEVTGGTQADGVLLQYADFHSRKIITNDLFKQYADKYPWLGRDAKRLIRGNLLPDGLISVEDMPFGVTRLHDQVETSAQVLLDLLRDKAPQPVNGPFHTTPATGLAPSSDNPGITEKSHDDQFYIVRTQQALSKFLELSVVRDYVDIDFSAPNWDVAVKRLEFFLKKNRFCIRCHSISTVNWPNTSVHQCSYCRRADSLSEGNEPIWNVVRGNAPPGWTGGPPTNFWGKLAMMMLRLARDS
jgi:hypothetical protein